MSQSPQVTKSSLKRKLRSVAKSSLNQLPLPVYSPLFRKLKGIPSSNNNVQKKEIMQAAQRLAKKLLALDISQLATSDYQKRYFGDIQGSVLTCMTKFSFVLEYALGDSVLDQNFHFLDYGGGTGIISLLARELGISKVYYNDIYEVSCQDFGVLSKALGYQGIQIICGDADAVLYYSKQNQIQFSALASYDVIEHIYQPKFFFNTIKGAMSQGSRIFMGSAANSFNSEIVQDLTRLHEQIELQNRPQVWGHKERDSLKSYFDLRKDIIENALIQKGMEIPQAQIRSMAKRSKGLTRSDILHHLDELRLQDELTFVDSKFPSNTCDPMTGNWAEHLIDFDDLKQFLNGIFAHVEILPESMADRSRSAVIGVLAIN